MVKKKKRSMQFDNISWKEIPIRELLMSTYNWQFIRDIPQQGSGVKYVLARCSKCGSEQAIPRSLFFRKLCMVPCNNCIKKVEELCLGFQVDDYKIISINIGTTPLKCTVKCMRCGTLKYDVDVNSLFFRKYKYELCDCETGGSDGWNEPIYFRKRV